MNRLLIVATLAIPAAASGAGITHDAARRTATIADREGHLVLQLNYAGKCVIDRLTALGRPVVSQGSGIRTGFKTGKDWHTSADAADAKVTVDNDRLTVSGIILRGGGVAAHETWVFRSYADQITWQIVRRYETGGSLEDVALPEWTFDRMDTWTGALLGTGGVAWCRLLDKPNATYGVHTGEATFWSKEAGNCLRIRPTAAADRHVAMKFSRQPDEKLTCRHVVSTAEVTPRHDLRRFLGNSPDVWAPLTVEPGEIRVEYALSALDYDRVCDRGTFAGLDGGAIREILNTIARIGPIDTNLYGTNGWYSGYVCLHENWVAQLGLAIDDEHYTRGYGEALDYARDRAILPDGRVKSRWAYGAYDTIPGSYDKNGFYEAQWGYLLDSQTGYVANVADQFDMTGDIEWLRRHKSACEKAIDYLLRRDTNGNGLVEMINDDHRLKRGSDWIDVVWASFENAYVNAQLYYALGLWTDLEELLSDAATAERFRAAAARLKMTFNKPIAEGGFWNPDRKWYAYWRDKDGSIHGNNLVLPVNLMAVAYEVCDDSSRRAAVLDQIEAATRKENLFFWPLCFYPYEPDEVMSRVNLPFPNYENGDIFLSWGEVGTRAYARYNPAIAVRYVRNVLDRYAKDGLAFQRYLRTNQAGAGDDILAGNALPIIGLYRNIYGIQPKHDRLRIEPHLTAELNGTILNYRLRGRNYRIALRTDRTSVEADHVTVEKAGAFAVSSYTDGMRCFFSPGRTPSLAVTRTADASVSLRIESWEETPTGTRRWSVTATDPGEPIRFRVAGLAPNGKYRLQIQPGEQTTMTADPDGSLVAPLPPSDAKSHMIDLLPDAAR
jgi:hypothetical protein